jgi:hypothetical protein
MDSLERKLIRPLMIEIAIMLRLVGYPYPPCPIQESYSLKHGSKNKLEYGSHSCKSSCRVQRMTRRRQAPTSNLMCHPKQPHKMERYGELTVITSYLPLLLLLCVSWPARMVDRLANVRRHNCQSCERSSGSFGIKVALVNDDVSLTPRSDDLATTMSHPTPDRTAASHLHFQTLQQVSLLKFRIVSK